jgi:hypothetical protein
MKIVGKEYFRKLPEWTVFALCDEWGQVESPLKIKGEVIIYRDRIDMCYDLTLCPNFNFGCGDDEEEDLFHKSNSEDYEYKSELSWIDTNMIDFSDNQKFMIFNPDEVFNVIETLCDAYKKYITGDSKPRDFYAEELKMIDMYLKMKQLGMIK